MMKKFFVILVILVGISITFSTLYGQTQEFNLEWVEVYPHGSNKVIIWNQNAQQSLEFLYPSTNYPIASCHDIRWFDEKTYCVLHPSQTRLAGIHGTWFVDGMYILDESGKYWGPYYRQTVYIPIVNR